MLGSSGFGKSQDRSGELLVRVVTFETAHPTAVIETQKIVARPKPMGSNIKVGTLAKAARLKLDKGKPPKVIRYPHPRPPHAPKAQRLQHLSCRIGDDLVVTTQH